MPHQYITPLAQLRYVACVRANAEHMASAHATLRDCLCSEVTRLHARIAGVSTTNLRASSGITCTCYDYVSNVCDDHGKFELCLESQEVPGAAQLFSPLHCSGVHMFVGRCSSNCDFVTGAKGRHSATCALSLRLLRGWHTGKHRVS